MQSVVHIESSSDLVSVFNSNSGVIIDVRTSDDYSLGHIRNAINLDLMSTDFADFFADLNRNTELFVYCMDGIRSKVAVSILNEMGFKHIVILTNGIETWDGTLLS